MGNFAFRHLQPRHVWRAPLPLARQWQVICVSRATYYCTAGLNLGKRLGHRWRTKQESKTAGVNCRCISRISPPPHLHPALLPSPLQPCFATLPRYVQAGRWVGSRRLDCPSALRRLETLIQICQRGIWHLAPGIWRPSLLPQTRDEDETSTSQHNTAQHRTGQQSVQRPSVACVGDLLALNLSCSVFKILTIFVLVRKRPGRNLRPGIFPRVLPLLSSQIRLLVLTSLTSLPSPPIPRGSNLT